MVSVPNRSHKKKNRLYISLYSFIVNFCANCTHPYRITTVCVLIRKGLRAVIRPDSYRISLVRMYNYIYTLLLNINRLPRYTQYPISGGIIKRSIKDSFFFSLRGKNRRFVFKDLYDNIIEKNKFNTRRLDINLRSATNYLNPTVYFF